MVARFGSTLSLNLQSVAVGWQVYDITGDPFALGLVGLAQFSPTLFLFLFTGAAADRFDRRLIMALALVVQAACAGMLVAFALAGIQVIWPILIVLAVFGVARAFINPVQHSLVANLLPVEVLSNGIALVSATFRVATVLGPLAGGLLYEISAATAHGATAVVSVASVVFICMVPRPEQKVASRAMGVSELFAGLRYILREKVVLGAITLDLFAVLLGGAVALLPVYARDILEVGPLGLGLLRAAAGAGGIGMALWLAFHPVRDHAGLVLFGTIVGFGVANTIFGLSNVVWLSVAALLVAGAADVISGYIRGTLIQVWTPDQLRGRVSAASTVFLNASNDVGAFRAGGSAALVGAVPAVVLGGVGAILVAVLWSRWFPELRKVRHLDGRV